MPNAVNESLPTYHYKLQIAAHITVTDSNGITVTVGLTKACRACYRALHSQCRTVTPFSQQSQLEHQPKSIHCSLLFTAICLALGYASQTSAVGGEGNVTHSGFETEDSYQSLK